MNEQFANDFHIAREMPIGTGTARGFGRGYTIGFATGFCLLVGSFVNIYLSRDNPVRLYRGIGYMLVITAAVFIFAIGYQIVQNIGIPWSVTGFGRFDGQGEFNRRKDPVRFWLSTGPALLFFAAMLSGGIWLCVHSPWVAARFG